MCVTLLSSHDVHMAIASTTPDDGKYSVLNSLPARYLTDLGTGPNQEFLTLILKSEYHLFVDIRNELIKVRSLRTKFSTLLRLGLGLG